MVLTNTLQSVSLMILTVRAIAGVDQEERGPLGNVQIGVVLVGEVGLECPHSGTLVTIAYTDKLVSVSSSPRREPDDFSKL